MTDAKWELGRLTLGKDERSGHRKTKTHKWICFERLAHYEDLEEQGRLLVLPCKVGDTVYVATTRKIGWWQAGYDICKSVEEMKFDLWLLNDFGKTVFLTRAEAEAALAKED